MRRKIKEKEPTGSLRDSPAVALGGYGQHSTNLNTIPYEPVNAIPAFFGAYG